MDRKRSHTPPKALRKPRYVLSDIPNRSDKEYFLRIEAEEIPQKKKGAVGVRGMRLAAHEQMQEIYVLPPDEESVVTVKEKEVALHRLHIGKRDTRGVKK